ncbi:MAG: hypothetical protein AB1424_08935 [Thermodesulfobacteriota bacterium]
MEVNHEVVMPSWKISAELGLTMKAVSEVRKVLSRNGYIKTLSKADSKIIIYADQSDIDALWITYRQVSNKEKAKAIAALRAEEARIEAERKQKEAQKHLIEKLKEEIKKGAKEVKLPKPYGIDWNQLLIAPYRDVFSMLFDLYVTKRLGLETIGNKLGVDKIVVRKCLVKLGIPIRRKGRQAQDDDIGLVAYVKKKKYRNIKKSSLLRRKKDRKAKVLGMWKTFYHQPYDRSHEKTDCSNYLICLKLVAIFDGNYIQCDTCKGELPWEKEWCFNTIKKFDDYLNSEIEMPEPVYEMPKKLETKFSNSAWLEG